MNLLLIYFLVRVIASQTRGFLTLGLIPSKPGNDFFAIPAIVPHAWYFVIQLTLVLLFANADINSRVASTCPFYYWAFAAVVREANNSVEAWRVSRFATLHNFAYMVLNFLTFPMEAAFF